MYIHLEDTIELFGSFSSTVNIPILLVLLIPIMVPELKSQNEAHYPVLQSLQLIFQLGRK